MNGFKLIFWVIVVSILFEADMGEATGFRIPDQSARASGQADAFVAQADDPSAIHYNPAGLVQLQGTHFLLGASLVLPGVKYESSSGEREESVSRTYFPPYGYFCSDVGTQAWRFGLGVNTPFGLGSEWSESGFSRYWSTLAEMEMININPTIAYQITPELSIGLGVDYYYSTLVNERVIDLGSFIGMRGSGFLDSSFGGKGYGDGWGYNAGVLYQPFPRHTFGLSFRSGIDVRHSGRAELSRSFRFLGAGFKLTSPFSTEIRFPASAAFGYAYRPFPELKLEIDIDWTDWSVFRELEFNFDNPLFPDQTVEKDWHDAGFYGFGAEYLVLEGLSLRAGLGFMESPIPEKTFDTTVARTKQYALGLGLGYAKRSLAVEFAYLGAFGEKLHVENDVGQEFGADLSGDYRNTNHLVSMSLNYKF